MAVPKGKVSRQRRDKRRSAHWKLDLPNVSKCPKCGADAKRETDTMPQWAGSSWYFLRYMDPHNDEALASKEALEYWGQVDWYNGGMEHTTLHLLYSRFWHKFLYDIGVVPHKEPYAKRTSHGMILGENGEKMSKSRGNVVNPDEIIETYGADTMRMYIIVIQFETMHFFVNFSSNCLHYICSDFCHSKPLQKREKLGNKVQHNQCSQKP